MITFIILTPETYVFMCLEVVLIVWCGYFVLPDAVLNPKKKVFDQVQVHDTKR